MKTKAEIIKSWEDGVNFYLPEGRSLRITEEERGHDVVYNLVMFATIPDTESSVRHTIYTFTSFEALKNGVDVIMNFQIVFLGSN